MSANSLAPIVHCFVMLKNTAHDNASEIVEFRVSPKYYGEAMSTGVACGEWNEKPMDINSLMNATILGIPLVKDHTVDGIEAILK